MKRAISYLALMIAGAVCVLAAYFCQFYYSLYTNNNTSLEKRIEILEQRLAVLEAPKTRELRLETFWGLISTTDQPADTSMLLSMSPDKNTGAYFEVTGAKGGPLIHPEFRLPAGSTTNCEYEINVATQYGTVVNAWVTHAEPYRDFATFEDFRVNRGSGTNSVRLIARARPGASVKMRFEIVVLCDR